MKPGDIWEALKWVWNWYPKIWELLIPDDPFRVEQVTGWRRTWMILGGLAVVFGWYGAPLVQSGLLACEEIGVFGFIGLAFLGWLIRCFPLGDDYPFCRPFACVAIYMWAPYLVPLSLYRADAFINNHWDKSIERYILAPDPAMTLKDALVNSAPYWLFALAAGLVIIGGRRMRSARSAQT